MASTAKGLTIAQRPNGSWRAQIRKVGFPYESRDFLTHEQADEWGLHRLGEIQTTGRLVNRRPAERTTLEEVIKKYIDEVTKQRPGLASRIAEETRLKRFLREESWLCGHAIAYLTTEHFETWRDRRLTENPSRGRVVKIRQCETVKSPKKPKTTIAPGTVIREMTLLKRVLDFAIKKFKLASNPMDDVERPSAVDDREVTLEPAEWNALMDACHDSSNIWLAPAVELAVEIGARRGSLLKLQWVDVNLRQAYVTLRGVKNSRKPSEIRNVQVGLSPRAIEILSSLPQSPDQRVLPVAQDALSSAFKRARSKAGLNHLRFHDLRHLFAARLVEADWGILDLMRQGDWRDPKSVKRYYAARGEHLGKKLAGLNDSRSRD
jgi:integrase